MPQFEADLKVFAKFSEKHGDRDVPAAGRYRHVVYGIVVESEFRLNSVDEVSVGASEGNSDVSIRVRFGSADYFRDKTDGLPEDFDDWIRHVVLADGSVYVKVDGVFETVISPDGRSVVCARLGNADQRSFEANLMNFVFSTALTLRGEEPLHATVLDLDGRAIGLLGCSGAGKSTLAAFLIAQGAELVTDDMLRLTFADTLAFAHYGPHRLKLFDEPAQRFLPGRVSDGHFNPLSGKIMIPPHDMARPRREPLRLAALFCLDELHEQPASDAVFMRRLAGNDLLQTLTSSAMNKRYCAPERLMRQFRFAERLAHTLPVYALNYARRYTLLDRVGEEIRRLVHP